MSEMTAGLANKAGRIVTGGLLIVVIVALSVTSALNGTASAQSSSCVEGGAIPAGNDALAQDCSTLLGLKDALRGTADLNWSAARPINQWDGVRTSGSPARVTIIKVQKRNLNGTIPPSIGKLDKLEHIWAYTNELQGPLPAEIGGLSNLKTLMLASNKLSGQIPLELNDLTLERLWLRGNQFTGCVPHRLAETPDHDLDRVRLALCSTDGPQPPIIITTPTPATHGGESLSDMVKRVRPAVVKISAPGYLPYAKGTGFIFDTDADAEAAYILTNFHVVEGGQELSVKVNDTKWYTPETVWVDPRRDLAVLQICCGDFVSVPFADSNTLFAGDEVIAIGYPNDSLMPKTLRPGRVIVPSEASVTTGIISAFRYSSRMDAQLLQTSLGLNPGNSGGPIFSTTGQVVAVHMGGFDVAVAENVSFSVLETTVQEKLRIWGNDPAGKFGPLDGEMPHDDDNKIESLGVKGFDATADEFQIAATFVNPYDADGHNWNYGFGFGNIREEVDPYMYFIVSATGNWYLDIVKADGTRETAFSGTVPGLLTDEGESNTLSLAVDGKWGWLHVNGLRVLLNDEPTRQIDLGGELISSHEGSVAVVTGYFVDSERVGSSTRFSDFTGVTYSHE